MYQVIRRYQVISGVSDDKDILITGPFSNFQKKKMLLFWNSHQLIMFNNTILPEVVEWRAVHLNHMLIRPTRTWGIVLKCAQFQAKCQCLPLRSQTNPNCWGWSQALVIFLVKTPQLFVIYNNIFVFLKPCLRTITQ